MLCQRRKRIISVILLVIASSLVFREAGAWLDKTHVLIVLEAVDLLKRADQQKARPEYEEIYDPQMLRKMLSGASDEDWVPEVRRNERSFRHYFDPDSPKEKKGVKFYFYYFLWGYALGAIVSYPRTGIYEGTLEWAKHLTTGNLHNWPGAISAYDYTREAKEEAYYRLGHVGHLLGDMSDADHATIAPHAGSSFTLPDDLEQMLGPTISARIDQLEVSPVTKLALRMAVNLTYIKLKHKYLGANYKNTSFERLIEDYVDLGLVKEYFTQEEIDQRVKPTHVQNPPRPPISGEKIQKLSRLDDYFITMARNSKTALQKFGEPPPLALRDLREEVKKYTEDLQDRTWGATPVILLPEPIHAIPTIDTNNKEEEYRYLRFAWPLVKESVEFDAGLFETFYDIVNHPPYVRRLEMRQEGQKGGRYQREWADEIAKKSTELKYLGSDGKSKIWKIEYQIVESRRLEPENASGTPFVPEEPASIKITFGPAPEPGKRRVDPNSVLVTVGGEIVPGRMVDEITWSGDYFPKELPEGESEKVVQLEISAKDLHPHFPRQGLSDFGYELDAKPQTPAKAHYEPPYDWKDYEPGPDKNHSIVVKRGEEKKEEETEEEEEEEPAREWPTAERAKPKFLIWIDKCGSGPGGRIHVGGEEEFKAPLRCRQEWLFGMSDQYVTKEQIGGPFETLEEAVKAGCGMISEAAYRNVPGWGGVPYAKMGGVIYLIDDDLAGRCIKK